MMRNSKYPVRKAARDYAIEKASEVMRSMGKFTIREVSELTGIAESTLHGYIQIMIADGRLVVLREYGGNPRKSAIYGIGKAINPAPIEEKITEIAIKAPPGGIFRDALVAALFGANGRARA